MRDKVDERRHFYSHEKKEILSKSKGRCAHCGVKLVKPSQMTVEHVIPLIKGGTNDYDNLVVLCETCNKDKGEKVILPSSYLTYLSAKNKKKVDELFESYCREVGYFSGKNYLFADRLDVPIKVKIWSNSKKPSVLNTHLYKALYNDLDEILEFCSVYYAFYCIDVDLYKLISTYYDRGAIYYSRCKGGDIDFVFFTMLESCIREDKIAYSIGISIVSKLSLSLSKHRKATTNSYHNYTRDLSYLKLDSILSSFINGVVRSAEDSGVSYGADVSIFWYERDERLLDFLKSKVEDRNWIGEDEEASEGMFEVQFTSSKHNEGDEYNWEIAADWNEYIGSIYDVEDEIALYTVLRDKKYMLPLLVKAQNLRNKRIELGVDVVDSE